MPVISDTCPSKSHVREDVHKLDINTKNYKVTKNSNISNVMCIPEEAQKCTGCSSIDIKHMFGDTPFCSDCYKEFGYFYSNEEERIVGILIEIEGLCKKLSKWFLGPSTSILVKSIETRLREAKDLVEYLRLHNKNILAKGTEYQEGITNGKKGTT